MHLLLVAESLLQQQILPSIAAAQTGARDLIVGINQLTREVVLAIAKFGEDRAVPVPAQTDILKVISDYCGSANARRDYLSVFLAENAGNEEIRLGKTVISCVGAGLGVTLLPKALIGSVWQQRRVAIHPLRHGEGLVETIFIRHRDAYASSALRAFLDLAQPAMANIMAAE